jgi:hypothetical protein
VPLADAEHVLWHPHVTVEKYSRDQTAWANFRLCSLAETGRRPELNQVILGDHRATVRSHRDVGTVAELHGDWLRELFPGGPEDGYAHADGNVLTNNGLTVLIKLLTGAGGTSFYPLAPTSGASVTAVVGVGTNAGGTGAQATHPCTDTHLTDDGTANAYYQGMDSTYPTLTTPATVNGQSTFASAIANFQWNEWCWATGPTGTATAGTTLASVWSTSTATFMLNHKTNLFSGGGATLGVKGAGASWVFSTTLVFS